MRNNDKLLLVGTIITYILLIFIPSQLLYPFPFIFFFVIASAYFHNIPKALFLTIIFLIPFSWRKENLTGGLISLFIKGIFPGLVILLSLLSIWKQINKNNLKIQPLITILLFFIWGIFSFIYVSSHFQESLSGILRLGTTIIFYILIPIFFNEKRIIKSTFFILITIIVFESLLTLLQFLIGHPLSIVMEEGIFRYPFGKLESESNILFRPFGTMPEPTLLARFLTMLLPIFLINIKMIFHLPKWIRMTGIILTVIAIFVSFTRFSWAVTLFILLAIYIWKRPTIKFNRLSQYLYFLNLVVLLILSIYFFPYFKQRWMTTPISFEERGSFTIRVNLVKEAINLISQSPLFGVGLNRFKPFAQEYNITGYFKNWIAPVHNIPLLIASEMGIPSLIFFTLFIYYSYKNYFIKRKKEKNINQRNILDAAALGGFIFILEGMMGSNFLSSHLTLFFLYMAILST